MLRPMGLRHTDFGNCADSRSQKWVNQEILGGSTQTQCGLTLKMADSWEYPESIRQLIPAILKRCVKRYGASGLYRIPHSIAMKILPSDSSIS